MEEDLQSTLTLWFHANKDKDGNPSNNVYGVGNCHVLRKNATIDHEHRVGAPSNHVGVCGMRRFQRGLREIAKGIASHGILAERWTRAIIKVQAKERQDAENVRAIKAKQRKLDDETEAIADLEALHNDVTKSWSNIELHRNIGHGYYAPAIAVDIKGGTLYTSDWAAFLAAEQTCSISVSSTVKASAAVWSVGMATLLTSTVGRYAGLVSFTKNKVVIESVELGIYNSGNKNAEVFSAKGDSGSLIWHMANRKARVVGQLHSCHNKGGSTSNHLTYCTPGWCEIKKRFKYADLYRITWLA